MASRGTQPCLPAQLRRGEQMRTLAQVPLGNMLFPEVGGLDADQEASMGGKGDDATRSPTRSQY